jgi:hypothetical protein
MKRLSISESKIAHAEVRVKEKESKLSQKLGQVNNKEKKLDEIRSSFQTDKLILKQKEEKSE